VLAALSPYNFPRNGINYTRHSERHTCALLKRPYQVTYYSVFHKIIFLGTCWKGFGGMGAVCNARGLVCGCVNRCRKFTPRVRVMYLESMRVITHMTQIWTNSDLPPHKVVNRRGRLAFVRGEVQLIGRLGRITLTVVFGMRGCVLVPTTPALDVTCVGKWACKSIGMKNCSIYR
jgi:hypothetical protein